MEKKNIKESVTPTASIPELNSSYLLSITGKSKDLILGGKHNELQRSHLWGRTKKPTEPWRPMMFTPFKESSMF
jgi:hypothetical protein